MRLLTWLLWKPIKKAKRGETILACWEGKSRIMTGYLDNDNKFRNDTSAYYPTPTHFRKLPKPM